MTHREMIQAIRKAAVGKKVDDLNFWEHSFVENIKNNDTFSRKQSKKLRVIYKKVCGEPQRAKPRGAK